MAIDGFSGAEIEATVTVPLYSLVNPLSTLDVSVEGRITVNDFTEIVLRHFSIYSTRDLEYSFRRESSDMCIISSILIYERLSQAYLGKLHTSRTKKADAFVR